MPSSDKKIRILEFFNYCLAVTQSLSCPVEASETVFSAARALAAALM